MRLEACGMFAGKTGSWRLLKPCNVLVQGLATHGTRATLGTPSNFQWHREAPRFAYQFYYDSQ